MILADSAGFAASPTARRSAGCIFVGLVGFQGAGFYVVTGAHSMQTRETTPLWVWLTFGLLTAGTVAYVSGFLMIEGILDFLK